MAWVKQSDRMWSDARFCAMSDGAQALWHRANSYLADQLLDGELPEGALKFLSTRKRYVEELEREGYWVRRPSGGWLAVNWQEIIRSKAHVLASREETKQRVSRHRNAVTAGVSNAAPGPDPVPVSSENLTKELIAPRNSERANNTLAGAGLVKWILNEHHNRYYALRTRPPAGLKREEMATRLGEWVEGASKAYRLGNQALAGKILGGLFASTSAAAAHYSLSWAVQNPEEFCGLPDGSALPARKPRAEDVEADRKASIEAKAAAIRADYSARIKAARDAGDDYTPSVLAAERDLRLSKIHAQAS